MQINIHICITIFSPFPTNQRNAVLGISRNHLAALTHYPAVLEIQYFENMPTNENKLLRLMKLSKKTCTIWHAVTYSDPHYLNYPAQLCEATLQNRLCMATITWVSAITSPLSARHQTPGLSDIRMCLETSRSHRGTTPTPGSQNSPVPPATRHPLALISCFLILECVVYLPQTPATDLQLRTVQRSKVQCNLLHFSAV